MTKDYIGYAIVHEQWYDVMSFRQVSKCQNFSQKQLQINWEQEFASETISISLMWQLNFEDILNYYTKVFYTMTDCYMSMPVYYRTYIDFGSGTPVNSNCDMLLYMYGRSVFSHIGPLLQTYLLNYTV